MRDLILSIWPDNIETLADLGCRDCWYTGRLPGVKFHAGIEIWPPAMDLGRKKARTGAIPGFIPVIMDALAWLENERPESWDAVLAIDLLEHLNPRDAKMMLTEMVRVSRYLAVVWTTLGMIDQGPVDVDGNPNPFEKHVWGPEVKDFSDGWRVDVHPEWHEDRGGAIFAWHLKS